MNKAELLEAIKDAPMDAPVHVFWADIQREVPDAYYIVDDPDEVTPIVLSF